MRAQTRVCGSRDWKTFAWFGGCGLILLASKLWQIGTYGNNTPFWDQWDAQAAYLFTPWLSGALHVGQLFSAHNEHRIFFTRLLALLLLEVNGQWSPLLEMCINAVLHVLALISAAWLLGRATGVRLAPALLMFGGTLLLCVPFGWENTLSGFQSQFYFVLLFSLWALWCFQASPFSRRWWVGIGLSAAAYFSLASGAIVVAAAACNIGLRMAADRGRPRELAAMAILACLFAAAYAYTPVLPGHADLKATSIWQFADGTITALAWPFYQDEMALVRNAPLVALTAVLLVQRPASNDPRWYIATIGVWVLLQALALAYGRGHQILASRYLDLHAMAVLANAAALLALAVPALATSNRRAAFTALLGWTFACVAITESLAVSPILSRTLAIKREVSVRQQMNLRAFLRTGDAQAMKRLRVFDLPYPRSARLAEVLADPRLVSILPAELQPVAPTSIRPGRLHGLMSWLLRRWEWVLDAGVVLLVASLAAATLQWCRTPGGAASVLPALNPRNGMR